MTATLLATCLTVGAASSPQTSPAPEPTPIVAPVTPAPSGGTVVMRDCPTCFD